MTPYQLRASFATLLLNAGASVLTVQALLGHQHVDTTLRYARVYDSTVAADYVRAARETERRFGLAEAAANSPVSDQQQQVSHFGAVALTRSSEMMVSLARQVPFICNGLPTRLF